MFAADGARGSIAKDIGRRVQLVTADLYSSELGRVCGCSRESARRYRLGAIQSSVFLARVCGAFDVDGHWLLTGQHQPQGIRSAIERASTEALLNELGRRLGVVNDNSSSKDETVDSQNLSSRNNGMSGVSSGTECRVSDSEKW